MSSPNEFLDDEDVTTLIDEFIAEHGPAELLDKLKEDIAGILEPDELDKVELEITGLEVGHPSLELKAPENITKKIEEALSESETKCDL